ncbi:putative ABC transporter substrate-binding protein [Streptomyces sp. Tu6071]|nr:putative ABC transporter substrate-binding protein [Streptomyces sp. Tu6071]
MVRFCSCEVWGASYGSRTSGVAEGEPRRVDLAALDGLVGEVPGGEPLRVLAVVDEVVDRPGERLREAAALLRRGGDEALECGARARVGAGAAGRARGALGGAGVVGDGRVGAEVGVDLLAAEREVGAVEVRVVLDVELLALLLELPLPVEEDALLVGPGADGDGLAREHLVVAGEGPALGLVRLEGEVVLPVGGELVLALALLGVRDVREGGVDLPAVDAEEHVLPRRLADHRLEAEGRRDEAAEVGLGARDGLLVAADEVERRRARGQHTDTDDEFPLVLDLLGELGAQRVDHGRLERRGLRRAVGEPADGDLALRRPGHGRGGLGVVAAGGERGGERDEGEGGQQGGAAVAAAGRGHGGGVLVGEGGGYGGGWADDGCAALGAGAAFRHSTLRRKSRVRGWDGWSRTWAGGPCSTTRPSSRKTTWSATSRAKPISWVTTTSVVPLVARSRMTSRTSPTSSGSSAEVGSSKSTTSGRSARARAMATRCCWPPESWRG